MSNTRLLSLDILRGLTVAGMILVNNGYGESFSTLRHSAWNGMTPCDLVFPFFLFIMGVSCYLSLSKGNFSPTPQVIVRIAKRTVLLFLIGLFINWFHNAVNGDWLCFDHLRLWAVLQRIALCYCLVSVFALTCNHRFTIPLILLLLTVYTLFIIVGNGYAEDPAVNIIAQVDLRLFGYEHLYHKSAVDPEGLLGTIPSVAHVLIGFYCGKLIKQRQTVAEKLTAIFVVGAVCTFVGYLLSFGLPLNKRIWSPSYVFATCGMAALLLALIMNVVDLKPAIGRSTALRPLFHVCRVFGVNALALYASSELLAILFGHFGVSSAIYDAIHAALPWPKWASLGYALTFVAINYALGYLLYRRKIYIKL